MAVRIAIPLLVSLGVHAGAGVALWSLGAGFGQSVPRVNLPDGWVSDLQCIVAPSPDAPAAPADNEQSPQSPDVENAGVSQAVPAPSEPAPDSAPAPTQETASHTPAPVEPAPADTQPLPRDMQADMLVIADALRGVSRDLTDWTRALPRRLSQLNSRFTAAPSRADALDEDQAAAGPTTASPPASLAGQSPPGAAAPGTSSGVSHPSRAPVVATGNKPPRYPEECRRKREQGTVLVHAVIEPDGSVSSVQVVRSSGYDLLDKAAVEAVRTWRFISATQAGEPIRSHADLPIVFVLRQ